MNAQLDELTKGLAQSVTRRAALTKIGVCLVGMALACFGLAPKGQANSPHWCQNTNDCAAFGESAVCCKWLGVKACVFQRRMSAREDHLGLISSPRGFG